MSAEDYIGGEEPWDTNEEPYTRYIVCKYCGKGGLQWHKEDVKWILLEWKGKDSSLIQHRCKK